MFSRQKTRPSGFTLLELLVVVAIIVALFAILAPAVMSYRNRVNIDSARARIKNIERALEAFATERGTYPTTEQGIKALIYIPLDETPSYTANMSGTMMQPGMMQPGMTGMEQVGPMAGGAAAIGPDMLAGTQPGGMTPNPMDPTGMGMQPGGMTPNPMDPTGMGMQPGGMTSNPMDPTGMGMQPGGMTDPMAGGMMTGGMMGGGMTVASGWNQPLPNPSLYVNARKRPDPLLDDDDTPLDPWRQPYRYDNSMLPSGLNRYTGSKKPAIWSAGPDKVDGTDDDIRNWDPVVANQQLMLQQQQGVGMGMQPGGMMTNPMDPTGMGMQPGGMMTDPMDPTGMGTQPGGMMTNPMDPTGMGTQPGMMTPPGGMMSNPMDPTGMGMQPGGMMPQQPTQQPQVPVM